MDRLRAIAWYAGTASALLLLTNCSPRPKPTPLADQSRAVADVFETKHPYSTRIIDSSAIATFLSRHPEYSGDSTAVLDFYQQRGMQFAWIVGDSLSGSAEAFMDFASMPDSAAPDTAPRTSQLAEIHDEAHAQEGHSAPCDSCLTDIELRLTAEFFRFADRRYNGYLSRDVRDLNWFIPRGKKDLTRLLDSMAVGKMDLSAYEPVHPQFPLLRAAIARYRTIVDSPWTALELPAQKRKLQRRDSAEVVGAIRHRLFLLGDLASDDSSERFDSSLATGVKNFQQRHGLAPDGVIGAGFFKAIDVPPADRLRTMLINIERLRWVPEKLPANLILVNIPEFRLHVFDGDSEALSMDVVVGARATHTVVFSDTLTQVVFSPGWTLPESITRNEVLPAIKKDSHYLSKHHMEIIGGSKAMPIIRQKPGPDNSLGLVKFLFPNSYGIYMHDTPAKSLFGAEARAFSHGCIRVSQPKALAEFLLRDDPSWTSERMDKAMHGGKELFVPLKIKRPVLIAYYTSWVDAAGRVNFRDDVYGHDARLGQELFAGTDSTGKPSP
jgi:murein L,D-transpeptidase YcbB/YkuD